MKPATLPPHLATLWACFEPLARQQGNYALVFEDWLTLLLAHLAAPGTMDVERAAVRARYPSLAGFSNLTSLFLTALQAKLAVHSWADLLGDLFMELSSRNKASTNGQFFTPPSLVDATVAASGAPSRAGQVVADDACGSGRLLLAWQARHAAWQPIVSATDLDLLCCKMSCLNLLLHGTVGEVVWADALHQQRRAGWLINPTLWQDGVLSVLPVSAAAHGAWRRQLNERPTTIAASPRAKPVLLTQLSFF